MNFPGANAGFIGKGKMPAPKKRKKVRGSYDKWGAWVSKEEKEGRFGGY